MRDQPIPRVISGSVAIMPENNIITDRESSRMQRPCRMISPRVRVNPNCGEIMAEVELHELPGRRV
jgi:hypothetical protein